MPRRLHMHVCALRAATELHLSGAGSAPARTFLMASTVQARWPRARSNSLESNISDSHIPALDLRVREKLGPQLDNPAKPAH